MPALGIIVEYNPFHNGHLYHLNMSKRRTGRGHVIAVMSGQFVQRGEPALCDKWRRTHMALSHGVDMVIELPLYYAVTGAEYFARGAVTLLHATGLVDRLCFGSECADIDALCEAGRLLAEEPRAFKETLKAFLARGYAYPAARAQALGVCMNAPEGLLSLPNNGLGIEYIKALYQIRSPIEPCTLPRAFHYPSAKNIRTHLWDGHLTAIQDAVPPGVYAALSEGLAQGTLARLDAYSDIFQYCLRTAPPEKLRAAAALSEGLENRFLACCKGHRRLSDLLQAVKTKRYTLTRLQRAALHILLGIERDALAAFDRQGGPSYIRVLGFRRESAFLLGELQARAALPVVLNIKRALPVLPEPARRQLEKEIQATDLYMLATPRAAHAPGHEYTMPLVIV